MKVSKLSHLLKKITYICRVCDRMFFMWHEYVSNVMMWNNVKVHFFNVITYYWHICTGVRKNIEILFLFSIFLNCKTVSLTISYTILNVFVCFFTWRMFYCFSFSCYFFHVTLDKYYYSATADHLSACPLSVRCEMALQEMGDDPPEIWPLTSQSSGISETASSSLYHSRPSKHP